MADNLLGQRIPYDNPSFRYDMSGPLNMLGRGTMKEGPAPTGYDRLFDTVYNFLGGKPENRRAANILATAADYGTLGMLTGAYDGGRELAQTGRPASLAMAIMPGARVAAPAAKAVGKAATEAVQGIRAYHGSPHDFDRFDMSRIGTGEGAQAYGHGLYFAENENVAKSYRDTLGNYSDTVKWKGSEPPNEVQKSLLRQLGGADASGRMSTVDSLAKELRQTKRGLVEWDDAGNAVAPKSGPRAAEYARIEQQLAELQRMAPLVETTPPGRMYEVNIKANPEDFLDWDKPFIEQSDRVKRGLDEAGFAPPPGGELMTGAQLYERMNRTDGGAWSSPKEYSANALRELGGIPGIRYLDQGSRVAGEGSRNFVIFDDSLIEILRKYGLLPPAAVGAAAASQSEPAQTVY